MSLWSFSPPPQFEIPPCLVSLAQINKLQDELAEKDQRLREYEDLIEEMRKSRENTEEQEGAEETESFQLDVSSADSL